jgi:hypothetical protein
MHACAQRALLTRDQFHFINPFWKKARLAGRPTWRRCSGFADRMKKRAALERMEMRQRRRCTKRSWQPRARVGPKQALIQKPVGPKACDPRLRQIKGSERNNLPYKVADARWPSVIRHERAQCRQGLVKMGLFSDSTGFALIARPHFDCINPAKGNIERAPDIALRRWREAGELLQFCKNKRAFGPFHLCCHKCPHQIDKVIVREYG